jgi:capsular exopolysaccharide synthesis family protein
MSENDTNWSGDKEYFRKRSSLFRKVFESAGETRNQEPFAAEPPESWHAGEYFHALSDSVIQSFADARQVSRIIALTSCYREEGVTTIAANLAASLAQNTGKRVAIVDANVADPCLHTVFKAERSPGFAEVICERLDAATIMQKTSVQGLSVLTAGSHAADPVYQCAADGLPVLIQSLREQFGYVVIDTPPMDTMNHVVRLSHLLDGILLVMEAERVRWEVAQRVRERLMKANAIMLGVVLNRKKHHIPRWLYKTL